MMDGLFENVSKLGFGVMRLSIYDDNFSDDQIHLIDYALNRGVNYFDTGYTYQNGYSEVFLKEALVKRHERKSFYIATKMPIWEAKSKEDLETIFNEQLRRLGVDYIDFYLLHAVTRFNWEYALELDILSFFESKKREGKILHTGFSFHDTSDVLERVIKSYDWEFCQLQVNFLDWNIRKANELVDVARKYGLPIVVMEPLTGGGLTRLPNECKDILASRHKNWSIASWGMRFVGELPEVAVVLSGMTDTDQIDDNVETLFFQHRLDEADKRALSSVVSILSKKEYIPCSTCKYCLNDCPKNIQIPGLFQAFNEAKTFDSINTFFARYDGILGTGPRQESCIQCGLCAKVCPQKIDIPKYMRFFNYIIMHRYEVQRRSIVDNIKFFEKYDC